MNLVETGVSAVKQLPKAGWEKYNTRLVICKILWNLALSKKRSLWFTDARVITAIQSLVL